jgi:hypothetical protein
MDIVIVPVYHRVQYTAWCLQNLLNARGIKDKMLFVPIDNHINGPDISFAINLVGGLLNHFSQWRWWKVPPHNGSGYLNSTHDALQAAYEEGAEKIYYIEDDVVVTPDFFEWHDAVQADGDWMCSSAWRRPEGQDKPHDPEAYYQVKFPTTISIGTCFKRDKLKIALETHDWNPQDRMLNEGWKCVRPYTQRCYHIGRISNHPGGKECPPEAVDALPDPLPDYGAQKVVFRGL